MSGFILILILITQKEKTFLPRWMTPEESLRIDEIGRGHIITAPPGGWVETPAEYEPVRGVLVTWDYGYYNSVEREIVRNVVPTCKAYIIASPSETTSIKNYLISGGVPLDSVRFFTFPYNSIWIRDYGPSFIRKQDNTEAIVDFIYNRPRPLDDTIPWLIGGAWGIPVYGSPLEHAGGNFMVDGLGTGFFSSLIYQENPNYTPSQIDSMMLEYNGLEKTIPLKRILTEYTGHIDIWTKALNDTLIMVGDYPSGHPNDTVLDNRADSISHCKNREGFPYRVVRIVMPYSTSSAPPTYLNSLFVNDRILVPLWGLPQDQEALNTYQQYLLDYQVVGIDCSAMSGSDAIHCITMQIPKSQFIHIRHIPLTDTNDTLNSYRVRAQIITSNSLIPESSRVFYKINSSSFTTVPLSPVVDTPGVYAGYIPPQHVGDTIYYYILTKNTDGVRRTSPSYVPPQYYSFIIRPIAVLEKGDKRIGTFNVYPNPFKDRLNFKIVLSEPMAVEIEIHNALGQKIKKLTSFSQSGLNTIPWNLNSEISAPVPSGVYFYKINLGKNKFSGKLLLIK